MDILFDKPKHISYCLIATLQTGQVVLIKSTLDSKAREFGMCELNDAECYDEIDMRDWITNSKDLPNEVGVYTCEIELIGSIPTAPDIGDYDVAYYISEIQDTILNKLL